MVSFTTSLRDKVRLIVVRTNRLSHRIDTDRLITNLTVTSLVRPINDLIMTLKILRSCSTLIAESKIEIHSSPIEYKNDKVCLKVWTSLVVYRLF